jgi:uncharacterized protein (TIGR02597 family)
MKPYTYSLLAAALACGMAQGAATAYTTPVGYVSLGNTAPAANNLPTGTDIAIAVPLQRSAEWAGTVASVDSGAGVVTLSGTPGFTANQWVPGAGFDPYTLCVEDGTKSGLVGLVTANGTDTVTVSLPSGETLADITAGAKVTIRKGFTPSSLFAGNTLPNGIQLLLFDGTSGQNPASSNSYSYDSGSWTDDTSLDDVTHALLYPGEGFVLRNESGTNIADLVVSGEVPTSNHRLVFGVTSGAVGQDIFFSYFSPVGELIGGVATGSQLASMVSNGDQLLAFDNAATGINKASANSYSFDSGSWTDDTTLDDVTNTLILQGGVTYALRRQAGATNGSFVWSDQPSYVPSL